MLAQAEDLIKKHEGLRLTPYADSLGILTIGYGRNLERGGGGITQDEALILMLNDLDRAHKDLRKFAWFRRLNDTRQAALCDLRYQLGPTTFRKFKKFMAALAVDDYATARLELLDSRYATQVPKRANEIANMIEAG